MRKKHRSTCKPNVRTCLIFKHTWDSFACHIALFYIRVQSVSCLPIFSLSFHTSTTHLCPFHIKLRHLIEGLINDPPVLEHHLHRINPHKTWQTCGREKRAKIRIWRGLRLQGSWNFWMPQSIGWKISLWAASKSFVVIMCEHVWTKCHCLRHKW